MEAASMEPTNKLRIARYVEPGDLFSLDEARDIAERLHVPLAYLFTDSDPLAEAVLAFGLLPREQQQKVIVDLKRRLFATERPRRAELGG